MTGSSQPGACTECGADQGEYQDMVERYRDLNNILDQINTNTEDLEETTYNFQSCWVAALMGEVCSDRDIRQGNISPVCKIIFFPFFLSFTA